MINDARLQHPSQDVTADPMFDSRRRWTHDRLPDQELPIDWTLAAIDTVGVSGLGLDDKVRNLSLFENAARGFSLDVVCSPA